jgi:D-glycero-alpha-D-manno-heptose-7-phosphate kinase
MIITRTPFRISFVGGGSDLESYYKHNGGAVLSTSINKYIYLSSHEYFDKTKSIIKYSKTEIVSSNDKIKHPIIKNVLKRFNVNNIDVNSIADIPSGTGMGSSSSFTVGLIKLFATRNNIPLNKKEIAEMACEIEINDLKEPIGKQDQYASSFGGLNLIEFKKNGETNVETLYLDSTMKNLLDSNLKLFYTGIRRSASEVLSHQKKSMKTQNKRDIMDQMVSQVYDLKTELLKGNIDKLGEILNKGWSLKKQLSQNISNSLINEIYDQGIKSGATGGKLLGAGAGGFLLFYIPQSNIKKFEQNFKLKELPFKMENSGSKIIYNNEK